MDGVQMTLTVIFLVINAIGVGIVARLAWVQGQVNTTLGSLVGSMSSVLNAVDIPRWAERLRSQEEALQREWAREMRGRETALRDEFEVERARLTQANNALRGEALDDAVNRLMNGYVFPLTRALEESLRFVPTARRLAIAEQSDLDPNYRRILVDIVGLLPPTAVEQMLAGMPPSLVGLLPDRRIMPPPSSQGRP